MGRKTGSPGVKVLITGSSGYCGRAIAARLLEEGIAVVGVDASPVRTRGADPGFAFERVDVRDRGGLREVFDAHGPSHVIHLAYLIDPTGNGSRDREVNVRGSRNVLEVANETPGVIQFVLASSVSAYGAHPDNPRWLREEDPLRPNDFPYAEHKKATEDACVAMPRRSDLRLVILRLCTVVGPGYEKPGGVLSTIARSPFLPSVIGADGRIQLIHEADLVEVFLGVVRDARIEGTFNLCPDSDSTIAELGRACDRPIVPVPLPLLRAAFGFARRLGIGGVTPGMAPLLAHGIVASPAKLARRLGYSFRHSTREAFSRAVDERRRRGTL
jgi:UDP-glucose 4-epimerase